MRSPRRSPKRAFTVKEPEDCMATVITKLTRKMDDKSNRLVAVITAILVFGLVLYRGYFVQSPTMHPNTRAGPTMKVASWNIAAINNNPFEYWITHEDAAYNKLMLDVQDFISEPGSRDVLVREVFTEDMFQELKGNMIRIGFTGIDQVEELWKSDFSQRRIVSEFMKDKGLGDKRLASMPDRTTNTILTVNGPVYRPTVINCYRKKFADQRDWWGQWRDFIFDTTVTVKSDGEDVTKDVYKLLLPIKRAKYPALTEDEEKISLPLQTLCGAIFDGILFHIVHSVSPTKWQGLRQEMCEALNLKKTDHTLGIITNTYGDSDVIFLQEVASQFIQTARKSPDLAAYEIISPLQLGSRDQNSVIFLNKYIFDTSTIREVTDLVYAQFGAEKVPVATGDILAIVINDNNGNTYMFVSFHGDTNGLATIPVLKAVHATFNSLSPASNPYRLLFGLDANTYEHATPGKTQDVLEWSEAYRAIDMTSVWGDVPDPKNHTTFNARTYLQPQLNKAARKDELVEKGDVNPKDFIVFFKTDFSVNDMAKDNTGEKKYIENMVFPTLQFPSDHGVLSATLKKRF